MLLEEKIERIAAAIESAHVSHSITLVRLVDGVATYMLLYDGLAQPLEFPSYGAASDHLNARTRRARAIAAIRAMQE